MAMLLVFIFPSLLGSSKCIIKISLMLGRGNMPQNDKASRKQSSLSGKESAQGCLPKRLLGRPDEALGGGNQGRSAPACAWKILWTEEPGRLQSMRSLGVRHG